MAVLAGFSEIGRWIYAPATDSSKKETSGARAVSEGGPLLSGPVTLPDFKTTILGSIGQFSMAMFPDEEILFGRAEGKSYDGISNLTLKELSFQASSAMKISERELRDGDIVLSVWPGQIMCPALVESNNSVMSISLPGSMFVSKGSRCFVMDEAGEGLITTSYPTNDGNSCRLFSSLSLRSWLLASSASCYKGQPFILQEQDDGFEIIDLKNGSKYIGKLFSKDASKESEIEELRLAVRLFGLRGAVASYDLKRRS